MCATSAAPFPSHRWSAPKDGGLRDGAAPRFLHKVAKVVPRTVCETTRPIKAEVFYKMWARSNRVFPNLPPVRR